MPPKKDELRFTILFSANDPRHLQAARVLNEQGRRSKAPYLVNTILHYRKCTRDVDIENAELESLIETVVRRILEQGAPASVAHEQTEGRQNLTEKSSRKPSNSLLREQRSN